MHGQYNFCLIDSIPIKTTLLTVLFKLSILSLLFLLLNND